MSSRSFPCTSCMTGHAIECVQTVLKPPYPETWPWSLHRTKLTMWVIVLNRVNIWVDLECFVYKAVVLILSVCLSTQIGRKLTDVSSSILFIVIWFRNWRLLTFWLLKRWFNSNCYSLKKKKLSIKRQDLLSFFKKGIMLIWLFCCFWKIWKV